MSSSSFRVTKFISAWNILISNVAIYKHGLQIHPYQHTFLTELQTEIHIPDSRKSCDIMSEAFLKMSSRHTLSLGLLTAVDGVKRAPWALDSVKSLLHSVSSSHGTISLDNDFSKLPEYDSLVKSLIEVMLNMDDVSNDKISHVAKLAMRTTVTLPECRISPIGREVIMKFLESVARTKSWSIYSRAIVVYVDHLTPEDILYSVKILEDSCNWSSLAECLSGLRSQPILASNEELLYPIVDKCLSADTNESCSAAYQIAKVYGFEALLPNIELRQERCRIRHLVMKNKWQIAATILKGPQSALLLFEELKLAGQFAEAQKVFQIYQLKDRTQPVTQQQIDQQLEHATEHFLQLPLHLNRVSFIHDLDSLTQAELHFSELNRAGAPIIVAVDVEWRDFDDTNGITGASILQIATGADVFIVDFLADWTDTRSSSKTRLKTFLSMIFGRKDIIKIGWDFGSSDIKQLRASANGYFSGCFDSSTIESVVDLNRAIKILYDAELLPTVKPSLEMGKKHGMSLSKACEFVLGKPLAKNQRMSDWNQRPLTQEQVVYAALDAHCMLTILRELLTHIHVPREAQGNLGTFVGTSIRNNAPDFSKPTKKQKRIINLLQSQGWVKLFLT